MPTTYYTTSGRFIQVEDKPVSAPGAEGAVHRILNGQGPPKFCAKIYLPHRRTEKRKQKLEFMIAHKPSVLIAENFVICWPVDLLFDAKKDFVGFVMALAFENSEKLYELITIKLSKRLAPGWEKFDRTTVDGIERRMKVCVNIAIAVNSIHKTLKYAIIDYKPQNLLITQTGKVSIIDVDSFQIVDNPVIYNSEVSTPEYAPPESQNLSPSTHLMPLSWDRFSLAVSYYELLFGIHPYSATGGGQYANVTTIGEKIQKGLFVHGSKRVSLTTIPGVHNDFLNLPMPMRNLFMKAFETANTNPNARASAEEWGSVIISELQTKTGLKPNTRYVAIPRPQVRKSTPTISTPYTPVYQSTPKPNWWQKVVTWWENI